MLHGALSTRHTPPLLHGFGTQGFAWAVVVAVSAVVDTLGREVVGSVCDEDVSSARPVLLDDDVCRVVADGDEFVSSVDWASVECSGG